MGKVALIQRHGARTVVSDGLQVNSGCNNEDGPKSNMDLSHSSIHNHSWKPIGPSWIWISKVSAAQGFGYPASRADVQRYGHLAHRVQHIGPPPPLTQSFADIVKINMARREQE